MKKTIPTFLLITALLISMIVPAFAATADPWGPNWYTPYTGRMQASSTYVKADNLKWSSSSLSSFTTQQAGTGWYLCTEYEFRPKTGHPIDYWDEPAGSDFSTNFPAGYKEFEAGTSASDNDTAVCCGQVVSCNINTTYYGQIVLSRQPGANFNNKLELESEYGIFIFSDALPSRYEIFQSAASFNTPYTW